MIEFHNASRWYGEVIGLNDVSCTIEPGLTALLGQNGAGKSTMMKLISGQLKPTTGDVLVLGEPPFANPNVFRRLGYCPEFDNLYETMSGRACVHHLARLTGMSAAEAKRKGDEAIAMVGMAERADRKLAGYSKGMRQRIKLAQAMVHDPQVILLDEPLNGLDPLGRREFIDLLGHLAEQGKAILVSSHILYEVEQMTRNILLLHRGRLLATGDLRVIRSLIDKHPHRIRIETPDIHGAVRELVAIEGVLGIKILPGQLGIEVESKRPDLFYQSLPRIVLERGVPISGVTSPDNNLESVFRYLVGS